MYCHLNQTYNGKSTAQRLTGKTSPNYGQETANEELWHTKREQLETVPGFDRLLTTTLVSVLAELGNLNPKEIAALVGAAPSNLDSGALRGKRRIQGGRAQDRTILYRRIRSATIQGYLPPYVKRA
ncbi:transposase [Microbulbifer spongiae]|uniref:Transposase n=1 Tax=Microbulbifer spongiae TaxID=2944933 RepID=A0ABY9E9B2_9GAMM|nr:transposase [Microbulbifer sp. MI-G]WKD49272.1 transposase [Microbulbifer sp. MI-G]